MTDQNIALLDFRADTNNAVLVEVAQCSLRQAWNIAGNLLRSELGISSFLLVFFDVNAAIIIFTHQRLRHANRVFIVITIEWHDRNRDVLTERQTTLQACRTVSNDLPSFDLLANFDNWALIVVGAHVRAQEACEFVLFNVLVRLTDHHVIAVYLNDFALDLRHHTRTRIEHDALFDACSDHWRFGTNKRHGLRLHV